MGNSKRLTLLLASAALLLLTVVACGSNKEATLSEAVQGVVDEAKSKSGGEVKLEGSCANLTADEIASATGHTVQLAMKSDVGDFQSCAYILDGELMAFSTQFAPGAEVRDRSIYESESPIDVKGLGVDAFCFKRELIPPQPTEITLMVSLTEGEYTMGGTMTCEQAETLARTAISRLE